MTIRTSITVLILLAVLSVSPGVKAGEAATLSSLVLEQLVGLDWGDFEDAGIHADVLVNWNLFLDSPGDTWQLEWRFYGEDPTSWHLLRTYTRTIVPHGTHRIYSLGLGNALRWLDEDYDYNPAQPNPDEIRLVVVLRRNGNIAHWAVSNRLTGYF